MVYLFGGVYLLFVVPRALLAFVNVHPAPIALVIGRGTTRGLLRGLLDMVTSFNGFGAWLLGLRNELLLRMFKSSGGRGTQKTSCVRSTMIEMKLDHDSGKMHGKVLAGPDEGKSLDSMTGLQCEALHNRCYRNDPEGARLMKAYLDRRFAGWRDVARNNSPPGLGSKRRRSSAMSEDEAFEVLGLQKGAAAEDVIRTHHSLIKKLHPDHELCRKLGDGVKKAA